MSVGTIEALICTVLFFMSGYISHEFASLFFPTSNDEVSITKQLLQYLLHSVINSMIYFPIILLLFKLFPFPALGNIANSSSNTLFVVLKQFEKIPHLGCFYFICLMSIICISIITGIVWGLIIKRYATKKKGLVKGINSWDRLFYDSPKSYVIIRLKQGEDIYGFWGKFPCFSDSSFASSPGILIEQCDSEFKRLDSIIWIPKDNIALLQIWKEENNE